MLTPLGGVGGQLYICLYLVYSYPSTGADLGSVGWAQDPTLPNGMEPLLSPYYIFLKKEGVGRKYERKKEEEEKKEEEGESPSYLFNLHPPPSINQANQN